MQDIRLNYVNGSWRSGEEQGERRNPSDQNDVVARFAIASSQDVRDAVAAARKGLSSWRAMSPQQRCDILDRVGSEIARRTDELATLLSREEGKTLPEARAEVTKAVHTFKYFSGEAVRVGGASLPSVRAGIDVDVRREPVGVVAMITPWNFPFSIPCWKTAPALAFGNCVILKPSELTSAIAWELAALMHDAGVPPGVFQLLMGDGRVGSALLEEPGIDAVSFTGSAVVGQKIASRAVPRGIKLQLELGGKNPLLVASDADMNKAVDATIKGAFYSSGQRCTASSRIIVESEIHDRFIDELVARTAQLRVGNALDSSTHIGPLVSAAQLERVSGFIEDAAREGVRKAFGGETVQRDTEGFFFQPTIYLDGRMGQTINREEVFGPVVSVFRAGDFDEAVRIANDTPYGLSAGIFTETHSKARAFMRASRSGMVTVNLPTVGSDYHVPFGGNGASGYGPKEMGLGAVEFYTQTKTIYVGD
ncbi:aldehyde dehydrogenase [Nitratireductor aquibiodomus RA22]|uniref:Aldehyde dehydrogenase n=1 Tax=Nitratireductor aquibiodomus RA22 TaxID=1189611 RepID=I5C569_9HYPH|nr:aldehyde dehydrogenase family protein [Nitratireductor aquibiodomus]EIM76971.1 aldehyde dehydrogenase [Nitratireductor aquibiodomus RA22]